MAFSAAFRTTASTVICQTSNPLRVPIMRPETFRPIVSRATTRWLGGERLSTMSASRPIAFNVTFPTSSRRSPLITSRAIFQPTANPVTTRRLGRERPSTTLASHPTVLSAICPTTRRRPTPIILLLVFLRTASHATTPTHGPGRSSLTGSTSTPVRTDPLTARNAIRRHPIIESFRAPTVTSTVKPRRTTNTAALPDTCGAVHPA